MCVCVCFAVGGGGGTLKKVEALRACKKELEEMIDKTNAHPILVRLAWHDAGTYVQDTVLYSTVLLRVLITV